MLTRMKTSLICFATVCIALFTFAASANAACASKPVQVNSSSLFPMAKAVAAADAQPTAFVSELISPNDLPLSIVGLWAITYFAGHTSTVWDQGFEQWHSDGTELNNDNAVPPSLGNVCVGVYKQIGPRSFKLRHLTWNFDASGTLTGTFQLLQTVTVSPNGKIFTGTYTADSFDLYGNVIPSAHADGVLSATRITVD